MTHTVTLELPESVARNAQNVAYRTHRRLEEVLVEWIDQAAAELPVAYLTDEQVLTLCDLQMEAGLQEELSRLLAENREGSLPMNNASAWINSCGSIDEVLYAKHRRSKKPLIVAYAPH